MNGWEFAKYLVDTMYNHWCITVLFLVLAGYIRPLAGLIAIINKKFINTKGEEE